MNSNDSRVYSRTLGQYFSILTSDKKFEQECPIDRTQLATHDLGFDHRGSGITCRACGAEYDDLSPEGLQKTAQEHVKRMETQLLSLLQKVSPLEAALNAARKNNLL